MLRKLRQRVQDEKGFTLIELLVVILIIGILAAIALPAFLGQREKAQDTAAKTQIRTEQTAMETYYTDNQTYTGVNLAKLKAIEPSLNQGTAATPPYAADPGDLTDNTYSVTSTSKSGTVFKLLKNADGTVTRSCVGTSSGCNGGNW
jgi:type IV pilus assembly protein PilA